MTVRDAIAEAIGVDDSRFDLVLVRGDKGSEGAAGGVRVDIDLLSARDGANTWQSIGNVARRLQEGLRHSAGDDKKRSGAGGATNAIRPLNKGALDGRTRDVC